MNIRYDIEKLKKIIDDICALTGLCMAVLDTRHNYLYSNGTEKGRFCAKVQEGSMGKMRCSCSDRDMLKCAADELRPVSHICHAGLRDTFVPVLLDGILAGFIIIGRVRPTEEPPRGIKCDELNMTVEEYGRMYMEMPYLSEEAFNGLIDLLSHILFENAIEVDSDKLINAAVAYIDSNVDRPLSVELLCKELYISKNLLYKKFRATFGCTVNEYVIAKRIKIAKEMLSSSGESLRRVAERCGFDNYTYFSKLFKKKTGFSPREYRASK